MTAGPARVAYSVRPLGFAGWVLEDSSMDASTSITCYVGLGGADGSPPNCTGMPETGVDVEAVFVDPLAVTLLAVGAPICLACFLAFLWHVKRHNEGIPRYGYDDPDEGQMKSADDLPPERRRRSQYFHS